MMRDHSEKNWQHELSPAPLVIEHTGYTGFGSFHSGGCEGLHAVRLWAAGQLGSM